MDAANCITPINPQMHSVATIESKKVKEAEFWELDKLKKTLSYSGVGIWTYNVFNRLFTVCEEVEGITGGSIKGVISLRNVLKIISSSFIRKAYYAFQACSNDQDLLQLELLLNGGKWILLKGMYNPGSYEFQGSMSDISGPKINDMNISTLIAKLGHELRSPLTTIRLYTQQSIKIAQNGNFEIIALLEMADRQISRINRLVDDFLLASTADGNAIILRKSWFFVKDIVMEILTEHFPCDTLQRFTLRISKKHIAFADREKIIQVLNNYISNALKYSPDTARIIINSQKRKDQLVINVQDFGVGISTEEQKDIFQKYYRCKNVSSIKGYGIGLYVVREIIEAHNGSFGVKSIIGRGSTFHFSIPVPN